MLRRWDSPTPFVGGLVEHECPRCHRAVELPFGMLCRACRDEIERKAARWANIIALASTVALAIYVTLRVPPEPIARRVGVVAVVVWFVLANMVVRRTVRELMK
jgi:hypothetical protein